MHTTAQQISDSIEGIIIGDPALKITGLSPIEADQANTITFFGNPRYEHHIYGRQTRAVLVPMHFSPRQVDNITFIKVENVYEALSKVAALFSADDPTSLVGISTFCIIDPTAEIGKNVTIDAFAIIGEKAIIGDGCTIHSHVRIGSFTQIGSDSMIHAGVKIMNHVTIGKRCIIYPNAVIGSEGFGHAYTDKGFQKIAHQASVIIEDDVEIGSNTCIDRGLLKDTIIRKGAKLDNLIQIAHGVEVGANAAIAAQTGVSGSSSIGERSQLGGQVGVAGHVTIAPDSKIQAKSGVPSDIEEPGKKWYGYPVLSYYHYLRSFSIFKRLPELLDRISKLEEQKDRQ